jgi:hypothetical protein
VDALLTLLRAALHGLAAVAAAEAWNLRGGSLQPECAAWDSHSGSK